MTIQSKDWKVRQSLFCIRKENKGLQAKLRKIKFHVLKEQRNITALDGAFAMGRHELTYCSEHGTALSNVEFRNGYLCEKENSCAVDGY